ncbi:naringenin,2-oxoglutarate 3-dioxygenase-like [Cryptomeria japonica]|uniref:naringenin,2-oxoglutarate 3-dioxygenase-like n=1 Tax=Cryptomeria japonica TaxID=3369 RepID=UPI0025ACDC43|nr:naringenin,2-oxoglutarate 3-dioxygenase-like [Cryptomeria japonica]
MAPAGIENVISLAESGIKELPLSFVKDENERPTVPHNVFCHDIPVISLLSSRGHGRDRVRAELKMACQEWGIFQVVDHQVPTGLTNLIMSHAMDFFSFPLEEKLEYALKPGSYLDYGNGSFIKDDLLMDWRELYVTRCLPRDLNVWPSKIPTMR